ncbi:STAS domain protein [Marinomonas spartinae]|uniref:STAS domain protein n=1 Tax=Marinomonas spartinae TaxID=1792290 RepID=A0A1A8TNG0_9GAMM|nr:STAS domain-containing protein [Marinomonas spartinae]SBS35356.1 STAS domain protein [Marinomonas spartinae]SBS39391.1 STAS domain protein [Marinomonas spartinae]
MTDTVISLPERFDFSTHKWFTKEYDVALLSNTDLVLDFSRVQYIDSSALGMMVLLHRLLEEKNKKGIIRNVSGSAKDILEMANFGNLYQYE